MKIKNNLYIYSLSHYLFLGLGFSTLFKLSSKDTYLAGIIGYLIGVIVLFIIFKASKLNKDNLLFKIFYFIYLLFSIFLLFLVLSNFLFSYFLPFTPSLFSCLPFFFLSLYLVHKKDSVIYNVSFILCLISLFTILIKYGLLINNIELSNLTPILSIKNTSLFKSSLLYCLFTTYPLISLINKDLVFKDCFKYYTLSNLINIINILFITLILGNLSEVYAFPEYAILRRINILSFIENIENFICLNWFFDLFISLTIFLKEIKSNLNVKSDLIPFIIILPILIIVSLMFSNNYYNTILIYNNFYYICFILLFFILSICFIFQKGKDA